MFQELRELWNSELEYAIWPKEWNFVLGFIGAFLSIWNSDWCSTNGALNAGLGNNYIRKALSTDRCWSCNSEKALLRYIMWACLVICSNCSEVCLHFVQMTIVFSMWADNMYWVPFPILHKYIFLCFCFSYLLNSTL